MGATQPIDANASASALALKAAPAPGAAEDGDREVAQAVTIEAVGFPTPTALAVRTLHLGYTLGEAPVDHFERAGGQSKLRVLQSTLDFLAFLAYLRMQLWLKQWGVIQL